MTFSLKPPHPARLRFGRGPVDTVRHTHLLTYLLARLVTVIYYRHYYSAVVSKVHRMDISASDETPFLIIK